MFLMYLRYTNNSILQLMELLPLLGHNFKTV